MLPWWCGYLKAANSPVEGGQELILKKLSRPKDTEKPNWNLAERWPAKYHKSSNIIINLKAKVPGTHERR